MQPTRIATLIALACLALAPATALAQSAGDEQYQDPLAPSPGSQQQQQQQQQPQRGGSAPATPSSGQQGSAAGSAPQSQPAQQAGPGSSSGQLPHTGVDAWALALMGAALLATGLALRRAAGHSRA